MIQLRRTIAVIVALLWTASALAQPTATVTHDGNLRPVPSTTRPPIRLLTPPEVVTLVTVRTVNGYYHVHTARGEDGWMFRSTLTLGSGRASRAYVTRVWPRHRDCRSSFVSGRWEA